MRSTFKKRLASLFVIFALLLVAVTGCGANGTREPIQPDSQGQISSTDDTTGQKQTSGDENAETTSSESGEDSTEDSTDTESTTDNKPGAIEPTTDNKPGAIEPTTGNKPGTTEPTTGNKPGTIEPTTGNKPGTTEPTAGEKPSATEPTTTKKPSTTEPTTTKKPSTTEPTTTKKPSTTESTTTQKPTTTQPTTTKKPATTTTQKPTTSSSSGSSNLTNAEKMAKEIVDDIISSNMTDFQKAITIHDWLIFNLDYDFTYTHYYVEETLRDRTCVCQGYALTFQMMAEMAGLGVTYVTGTGTNDAGKTESHAWNQVKIDGKWYNVGRDLG